VSERLVSERLVSERLVTERHATEAAVGPSADAGAVRWLVSGYYGADNLGDEALLAGLVGGLRARGARRLSVLSLDPGSTRAAHHVDARHRLLGLPGALLTTDVLVSGGGGLLQDSTSRRSLDYYLGVIRAARSLGRRVVVYGQSLGPLGEASRDRVRRALHGLPLGLRDAPSLALAAALGLSARPVADAALTLAAPAGRARDALVLVPRGGEPWATETLRRLGADALAQGLQVEVLACQPSHDDIEVERLRAALPGLRRLPSGPPATTLQALAGARLVASVRLHGLVLATVAGVPHAGLSYDPKVAGFAERSGAPVWAVPRTSEAVAATSAALGGVLRAPPFDAAARRSLLDDAHAGIDWLVHEALHARS